MSAFTARRRAQELIDRHGTKSPPVNVEAISQSLGLKVLYAELGEGVSGLLVTNPTQAVICVNSTDASVRQRFTIAHEIGHHVLRHQFEEGAHVHVDKGNYISQRSARSSAGIDPREIEANQFAAALLMPENLVKIQVKKVAKEEPLLERHVQELAQCFVVSEQAMTIRLTTLGML